MAVTEGNPHKTSEEECYLPPLNSEFHKNYLSSDVVNSKLFHVTDALKNQRIETIFRGDSENHLSVLANHLSWSNGSTIGEPNRYGPLDPIDSLGQYRMGSTAPTESVEKHSQLYQEVLRGTKNQNCLAVLSELSNNAIAGADFEHKNCREDLSGNGDELTDLNTFPQVLPAIPSP
jgi:hypothetical protein